MEVLGVWGGGSLLLKVLNREVWNGNSSILTIQPCPEGVITYILVGGWWLGRPGEGDLRGWGGWGGILALPRGSPIDLGA